MIIGVLKESAERRVSVLPEHIDGLKKLKLEVWIENECGLNAYAYDNNYLEKGVLIKNRREILENANLILSINQLSEDEYSLLKDKILLGCYFPLIDNKIIGECEKNSITSFSLDLLPRTTRAQSMDVLSSQANISGYKAVVLAAAEYPRYFPMFMTAAGSIAPAKVLILGAGVAGLQAIATAKRLGAVVEVFDTRPAVKEEVQSLGGKFIEVEGAADASKAGGYAVEQSQDFILKQKEKIAQSVKKSDIIITTAQIPGKKAPILIEESMLDTMKVGSVIIDLAAQTGGNTPFTENQKTVIKNGVKIIGNSNLAATLPSDASKVYGKNILNFLSLIIDQEGNYYFNANDELVTGSCLTKDGTLFNERIKSILQK